MTELGETTAAFLLVAFVCIALAAVTAWVAERHGRSFWIYFAFCAVFPLAAPIALVYLVVFTRRVDRAEHAAEVARLRLAGEESRRRRLEGLDLE